MKNLSLLFCLICLSTALQASIEFPVENHEYEVRIHTPDTSVILAGTLLVPENNYKGTVVLMITGSGDFTIKIIPEQDHFFLRKPGEPVGVNVFKEMVLSEELIHEISHWIRNK